MQSKHSVDLAATLGQCVEDFDKVGIAHIARHIAPADGIRRHQLKPVFCECSSYCGEEGR